MKLMGLQKLAVILTLVGACFAGEAHAQGFASPSGNIRCYLDDTVQNILEAPLHCLIFEADWDPALGLGESAPDCDLDSTRMVILSQHGGARFQWACHGDMFWPEPLPVLTYGSGWQIFGFDCAITPEGVRCTNRDGYHGFSMARRHIVLE